MFLHFCLRIHFSLGISTQKVYLFSADIPIYKNQILADQKTAAAVPARRIITRHPRFSDLPPSLPSKVDPSRYLLKENWRNFPLLPKTVGNCVQDPSVYYFVLTWTGLLNSTLWINEYAIFGDSSYPIDNWESAREADEPTSSDSDMNHNIAKSFLK